MLSPQGCADPVGDCDSANIVYYPRYFEMFDDSNPILFEARASPKQDIIKKYGLVGIPMVDTRAKFYIASTHGDWIRSRAGSRVSSARASRCPQGVQGESLGIEAFANPRVVGRIRTISAR